MASNRTLGHSLLILASIFGITGSAWAQTLCMLAGQASAASTGVETAIRSTLSACNAVLNGGRSATVLPLYTADGTFTTPCSQSSIGQDEVRQAYDHASDEFEFNIAEIVQTAPDWTFVRTSSAGTTLHHSVLKTILKANQELSVRREGDEGTWQIARSDLSFNDPPGH